MEVKIKKRVGLSNPTMLCGWPGMGAVGIGAIDYIRRKLDTEVFAEIDITEYAIPNAVIVRDGIMRLPPAPKCIIYYRKYPDLLIFESDTQLYGKNGIELMETILRIAKETNVRQIFTGAAFPLPISCKEEVEVYATTNKKELRDYLIRKYKIKIMNSGEISGLNGLIINYAEKFDIQGVCFLATMPLYAIEWRNPKSSLAIVKTLLPILEAPIDTTELEMDANEVESEMLKFEEKLRLKGEELKDEIILPAKEEKHKEIPEYVYIKIERLFKEAKRDKTKAYLLKKELDRWNLFEKYEDRFLDLFKSE